MKRTLDLFACALLAFACSVSAASEAPEALVKSTVDEVLTVINQNHDKHVLRELAEKKVLPHFDFKRMTQIAVGKAWRRANPTQQHSLEREFRALIVNTYTDALVHSANGNRVDVSVAHARAQSGGEGGVKVETLVKKPGKPPLAIDYRLEQIDGGWKVYDVIVEHVSLVMNYRETFSAEISRSGVDGLIKSLEEKNRGVVKG